jgi:uncharacterized protein (TIGR00106 family)
MVVQFSVIPLGGQEELKEAVAAIIDLIDRSGLPYQLNAMSTLLEGEWEPVMGVVRQCHEKMRESFPRVLTSITIDDRANASGRLKGKVSDVESVLGRELNK